jgi:hypothetical protein
MFFYKGKLKVLTKCEYGEKIGDITWVFIPNNRHMYAIVVHPITHENVDVFIVGFGYMCKGNTTQYTKYLIESCVKDAHRVPDGICYQQRAEENFDKLVQEMKLFILKKQKRNIKFRRKRRLKNKKILKGRRKRQRANKKRH